MNKKVIILSLILMSLYGCANTSEFAFAKVIHQSPQCGISEAGIERVEQIAHLKRIVNHSLFPANKPVPLKNLEAQNVVSISMGMKPSAGYSLTLNNKKAKIENHTVYLDIGSKQPGKDSMSAMVMTSPCIVVSIDKGHYSTIKANSYSLSIH